MKKITPILLVAFLFASCGGDSGSGDDVFFALASQILPSIKTTTTRSSVRAGRTTNVCDASPTGTLLTICDTFETYTKDNWNNEEATLGHRVSMTNFYKFMIQTDAYISDGLRQTCEAVNGKVKVDYDDNSAFWTSTDNYACKAAAQESSSRFKAYAWDQPNNKYAVLYDHQDDTDEAMTFGSKTGTTFDLSVKSGAGGGSYRRFTGSTADKTFTMADISGTTPITKLVLAGFSQGLSKHFLAKVESSRTASAYYCFTIDAQQVITTSDGSQVTVISELSSSEQPACNSTSCGGCEADSITVNGTAMTLPVAADTLMTGITPATGYQPTQHFKHQFDGV